MNGTIILVQVDPAVSRLIRGSLPGEERFLEMNGPEEAVSYLERGDEAADLLVLGPQLRDPVRLAQRVHAVSREAGVFVLSDPDYCEGLNRAIRFTPFLGSEIYCHSTDDAAELTRTLASAVGRIRRKRLHQAQIRDSRRRMAEAAPTQPHSLAYLDRLLDHAPVGVVAADADGRVQTWNRYAGELFRMSEREALDRRLTELFADEDREALAAFIAECGRTERRCVPRIFRRITADGRAQFVEVTATALSGRSGETGAMVILQDVTERVEAEREAKRLAEEAAVAAALQGQADELRRSNRELEQFAYVASHDLQEPLRKITSFGDRLMTRYGDRLDEQGRGYLERVQDAAGRMSRLITDLLAYSRVSTTATPFAPVNLNEIVREVVSDLEARIEEQSGRVEIGPLPTVEADALQMRQLFQNLIGNALKFRRPDVPPVVRVAAETLRNGAPGRAGPAARITVEDNGIGFDERFTEQIFAPFQRLENRDAYEGSGIGLAICRKIVERHGGQIAARSRPGEGSTFTVTLPLTG